MMMATPKKKISRRRRRLKFFNRYVLNFRLPTVDKCNKCDKIKDRRIDCLCEETNTKNIKNINIKNINNIKNKKQ